MCITTESSAKEGHYTNLTKHSNTLTSSKLSDAANHISPVPLEPHGDSIRLPISSHT